MSCFLYTKELNKNDWLGLVKISCTKPVYHWENVYTPISLTFVIANILLQLCI